MSKIAKNVGSAQFRMIQDIAFDFNMILVNEAIIFDLTLFKE